MKYVFSRENFIKNRGIWCYKKCKPWVDECDGKEAIFENDSYGIVKGIKILGYLQEIQVLKKWCEVGRIDENS